MFGLPMEIVGPVLGIGALMMIAAAGIVSVRVLTARFAHPQLRNTPERDALLEDVEARLAELDQLKQRVVELEERVDFAERVLAQQREARRLEPPKE
jgi:cell division protein FtsB